MIIACPACQTRYVVPDTSIGVDGRTVRCAKCRHSWFQEGASAEAVSASAQAEAPAAPPAPPPPPPPPPVDDAPAVEEDVAPEPDGDTAHDSVEEEAASVESEEDAPAPPPDYDENTLPESDAPTAIGSYEDEYDEPSQFDYEPPFRPRRNPLKIWTAAAAIFAVLALGTIAAVNFWGLPDWVPVTKPTFGMQQKDLQLEFPAEQQDRRTLDNGAEYFGTSGTVTNTGRETREVPPILIVLRDERDRIVYSWEVTPPKRTLAPGESVRINEAVTDVPRSAAIAEIGWKPR